MYDRKELRIFKYLVLRIEKMFHSLLNFFVLYSICVKSMYFILVTSVMTIVYYFFKPYINLLPEELYKLVESIIVSILTSGFIYALLVTPNPIKFGKAFVVNDKKVSFRYWIKIPPGHYMTNVKVKITVAEMHDFNSGDSVIKNKLFYRTFEYNALFGVRTLDITTEESYMWDKIIKTIKIMNKNVHNKEKNYHIQIIIVGEFREKQFTKIQLYKIENLINGKDFKSIRRSEYDRVNKDGIEIINLSNWRKYSNFTPEGIHVNKVDLNFNKLKIKRNMVHKK